MFFNYSDFRWSDTLGSISSMFLKWLGCLKLDISILLLLYFFGSYFPRAFFREYMHTYYYQSLEGNRKLWLNVKFIILMLGASFELLRIDLCRIAGFIAPFVSFKELSCFGLSRLRLLLSTRNRFEIDIVSDPFCGIEILNFCSDLVLFDFEGRRLNGRCWNSLLILL